jgi:multidrug resistance efflux pump
MTEVGNRVANDPDGEVPRGRTAFQRVSFLDHALWRRFSESAEAEQFVKAWLGLQCQAIGRGAQGVAVLGKPDEGPFQPAAFWPDEQVPNDRLAATAELALEARKGVVEGLTDDWPGGEARSCWVAHPFLIDNRLHGVVALELTVESYGQVRGVMRQLQWGAGWIEAMLRREQGREQQARFDRMGMAFDMIAVALEQQGFQTACSAIVTELATRLNCDLVSIGFVRRRRAVVTAVSHAARFGGRMNLIRDIGAAMDEAIDQKAVILYPRRDDWDFRIDRCHSDLLRVHSAGSVLTVPLHSGGQFVGALTFERPPGTTFDDESIELCDCVAAVIGPLIEEKRHNDRLILWKIFESVSRQARRLFGLRYVGRKLAAIASAAVIAFFSFATDTYRVTSPAIVEAVIKRSLVTPFDGYIAAEFAHAGEVVQSGQLLAKLDDRELMLERLRWNAERAAKLTEYDRSLAERDRAKSKIIQTDIERIEAQIALLDFQISRAQVRAPFDGVLILGDLRQMVGASVRRGDELFQIAPLESYRIVLKVDEREIADIAPGQRGSLVVSAIPDESVPYTVELVTAIAESQEGRNFFRVEARLDSAYERLRPGMSGVAKTQVDERLLIRIWTASLIDWLRIKAWQWLP